MKDLIGCLTILLIVVALFAGAVYVASRVLSDCINSISTVDTVDQRSF